MGKVETIDIFIRNFVLKERRERAELELKSERRRGKFAGRLNHTWDKVLDMRYIVRIPDNENEFSYVGKALEMREHDKCYLISNYDDIDGQVMEFKAAFDRCYGRGFATIIVNLTGDKMYLETEIDYGKQNRFIGKR